ncbi:peptidylprolyl isomerase [Vagococcus coleopterorum]|uniref:Foldase protein PrsA n=1 Tax=Vagococcus coleopterorum TaxID=2714946 RepID=A0A6G8AKW3_9ENTE|nr:peptidylprolyl isomerase [Vagococcus coleopterorum]QIL45698.1 peptidylprolyl isomerase [Vagococcus coleopterorum]
MKKNKIAVALVGMVCAMTLAACSPSGNEELVTMKGDKITVGEFFQEIKKDQNVQQSLQNTIIFRVAENAYGKDIDKKDIEAKLDEVKAQFGDTFEEQLKSAGFTEASYKDSVIKPQLAFDKMLDAHVDVKDKDLESVWADFHPEVDARLISVKDKETAEKALEEINVGTDFETVAREKSEHASSKDKGAIKFNSASQELPEDVKEAAFKLKNDEMSEIITSKQMDQMGQPVESFYIVKMVKNQEKGTDMSAFKDELTKIAADAQKADQEFIPAVIGKELTKANVKVTDDELKNVLSAFVEKPKEDKKEADSKDKDKKDDADKDEKTTETKEADKEESK